MTKNLILSHVGMSSLTVSKVGREQAKLISLNKQEKKPKVLMPPAPEKYLKAKKHDFL